MAKIDPIIEQKIKDAASIMDVMQYDLGVQLHRCGSEYEGFCPFHNDMHLGSFKVSESKNIATCFSCGKTWNPIDALMEGLHMDYPTALRHLAARYNIWIDDEPKPKVRRVCKPRPPQPVEPPKQWNVWSLDIAKKYMHQPNVLLTWMLGLPMNEEHKSRLRTMIDKYYVGTSLQGYTQGWIIWPQVDMKDQVRDMKFMKYHEDGHRDKTWNPNWMSAMLAKNKIWDNEKNRVIRCLFGLHLAAEYPEAEICLVESEKTALLCSAFCDPNKRIWMACGGLSWFKPEMIDDLVAANRHIIVYPDIDGKDRWAKVIEEIGYPRMTMTTKMKPISKGGVYNPEMDGPKADIADIMVRIITNPEPAKVIENAMTETDKEKVARMLGTETCPQAVEYLMDKLDLHLD